MSDTKPIMLYFGPWDRAGHYFHWENGCSAQPFRVAARLGGRGIPESFPWQDWEVDGKLQPGHIPSKSQYQRSRPEIEGEAHLHHKNGWTALAFWDRSVDHRGASNSTYFAEGTFTFDDMVAMAKERFAERWNKMRFEVVLV